MGKPDLVAVTPRGGIDEADFLGKVAAVETGSEHPLAHAIVEGAKSRGVAFEAASDLSSTTGEGVEARVGRSEEHTSELQALMRISYAVFCLKKKKTQKSRIVEQLLTRHLKSLQ